MIKGGLTRPGAGKALGGGFPSATQRPGPVPKVNAAPAPPAPDVPDAPKEFDAGSLRLKYDAGNWQLYAGTVMLKDFGRAEAAANEALQVLRDLRVNAHGAIGDVFEYYLADGQAPSGMTRHRQVVHFNPEGTRVEQVGGNWCLRDERLVLYNFGPAKADAEAALAVCRKYGFNQLGYVGHPTPALKYLLFDPQQRLPPRTPPPVVPASARMQVSEQVRRPFVVPGEGVVGTSLPLDYRRLGLKRDRGGWTLDLGPDVSANFGGAEREGRALVQALQQLRCTEVCRVGDTGFGFFLVNGRAPQGTLVGLPARPIRADRLTVRQVGASWAVCDGPRPLAEFGDKAEDARRALAAIKHFDFDHVCTAGAGRMDGVLLLVKSR
jgi:hypothetical protein